MEFAGRELRRFDDFLRRDVLGLREAVPGDVELTGRWLDVQQRPLIRVVVFVDLDDEAAKVYLRIRRPNSTKNTATARWFRDASGVKVELVSLAVAM
jgi:hypothetical protein